MRYYADLNWAGEPWIGPLAEGFAGVRVRDLQPYAEFTICKFPNLEDPSINELEHFSIRHIATDGSPPAPLESIVVTPRILDDFCRPGRNGPPEVRATPIKRTIFCRSKGTEPGDPDRWSVWDVMLDDSEVERVPPPRIDAP